LCAAPAHVGRGDEPRGLTPREARCQTSPLAQPLVVVVVAGVVSAGVVAVPDDEDAGGDVTTVPCGYNSRV